MKDIDKMSSNELRAEVRVLRAVCEASDWLIKVHGTPERNMELTKAAWDKVSKAIVAVEAQEPTADSRQADKVRWEYEQGFDAPEQVEAPDEKGT